MIFVIFLLNLVSFTKNVSCSTIPLAKLVSISKTDERFQQQLHNYYIKSSYNSCSTGQFQNGWVNLCALENVIKQGCRLLDFEIYQVDGNTVVATSNSTKFTEKGTFNTLSIDSVMKLISEKAVSNSMSTEHCPNSYDPLFLHFRIKSNKPDVYNQLADAIVKYLDSKLLSNEHSYENQGKNLGEETLHSLLGKVIIIVDKIESNHIRSTKMEELVNITGKTLFLYSLPYNDIVHTPDMDEFIEHNKKYMTIGYPNLSSSSKNYNSSIVMQFGVQMPCMCFQTNDTFLKTYNDLFEEYGYAFMIKSEKLRQGEPVEVKEAPPINPSLSYGYKTYISDLYQFKL
jgi:hypothetical protein